MFFRSSTTGAVGLQDCSWRPFLLLGDPEVLSGQAGCLIPPVIPGTASEPPRPADTPGSLWREAARSDAWTNSIGSAERQQAGAPLWAPSGCLSPLADDGIFLQALKRNYNHPWQQTLKYWVVHDIFFYSLLQVGPRRTRKSHDNLMIITAYTLHTIYWKNLHCKNCRNVNFILWKKLLWKCSYWAPLLLLCLF